MTDKNSYVDMMIESLRKKINILERIQQSNEKLEELAVQPEMDLEELKQLLDEKDGCIAEIAKLDEGFQTVYERLKEELQNNKQQYKTQIQLMQQLIREITDYTATIQAYEIKNRARVEEQFTKMRKNVRNVKTGVKVAQNYYKSMSKLNVIEAQFLDKKK